MPSLQQSGTSPAVEDNAAAAPCEPPQANTKTILTNSEMISETVAVQRRMGEAYQQKLVNHRRCE